MLIQNPSKNCHRLLDFLIGSKRHIAALSSVDQTTHLSVGHGGALIHIKDLNGFAILNKE